MEFKTELVHPGTLTQRQSQIMVMVCNGLSDKMISDALAISLNTVARHIDAVYDKLGLHNAHLNRRVALLRVAIGSGMVKFLCVALSCSALLQDVNPSTPVCRLSGGRVSSARRFD